MMLDVTMTLEFARWGDLFERFFRVEIEELCFLRPARRPFTSLKPIGHLGLLRLRPHRFPCPKLLSLSVQTVVKWSFFFFDGIRNLLKKVQSQLSANRCGRQETRKVRAMKLTVNGQERVLEGADPDMPLLWAIRDLLGLKGTKFGCGRALCGACTVHLGP